MKWNITVSYLDSILGIENKDLPVAASPVQDREAVMDYIYDRAIAARPIEKKPIQWIERSNTKVSARITTQYHVVIFTATPA